MLFVNRERMRRSSLFSRDWLAGAYTLPHVYLADGIKDFSDEKDQIIPTPWYTFPGHLQKNMIGAATIFFAGCTFQKKFDETGWDEVRKRATEKNLHDLKELSSQYSDWDILFNQRAYQEFTRERDQLFATFIEQRRIRCGLERSERPTDECALKPKVFQE